MGTKHSTGTVSIALDHCEDGIVFHGTEMKGKTFLEVIKEKNDIEMLEIEIVGEEVAFHTYSSEKDGEGSGSTACRENYQFFNLCCQRIPFIDGFFSPGSYEFPFEFSLPENLPASMKAVSPSNQKDYCSISYRIEAKIKNSKTKKWEICESFPFSVPSSSSTFHSHSALMEVSQFPLYIPPQFMKVKSFSCLEKGTMLLGLYSPTAVLSLPIEGGDESKGPGISASVDFEVSYLLQNSSTIEVKGFEVAIVEHLLWKPEETPFKTSIPVFSKKLQEKDILYYESTSLSSVDGEDRKMRKHLEAMKAVIKGSLSSSVSNSSSPHETFHGRLITIQHELVMTVVTSSFGTNNPTISTPIILTHSAAAGDRLNAVCPTISVPTSSSLIDININGSLFFESAPVSSRSTHSACTDSESLDGDGEREGEKEEQSKNSNDSSNDFIPMAEPIHQHHPNSRDHSTPKEAVVAVAKSSSRSSSIHCCLTSVNNFSNLRSQLKKSYFPLLYIQSWLLASSPLCIESLSPLDFQQLFLFVIHPLDQLSLSKLLMKYRSNNISVHHIERCLEVCSKVIRLELVKSMMSKVNHHDGGNDHSSAVVLLSPPTQQKRKSFPSSSFIPSLFASFSSSSWSSSSSSSLSAFEWLCFEENSS
jgi:hypothetical protein